MWGGPGGEGQDPGEHVQSQKRCKGRGDGWEGGGRDLFVVVVRAMDGKNPDVRFIKVWLSVNKKLSGPPAGGLHG